MFQSTPLANERRKCRSLEDGIETISFNPLLSRTRGESYWISFVYKSLRVSIHSSREREEKVPSWGSLSDSDLVSIHSSREREEKGWITSCRYRRAGFQSTPLANERRKDEQRELADPNKRFNPLLSRTRGESPP